MHLEEEEVMKHSPCSLASEAEEPVASRSYSAQLDYGDVSDGAGVDWKRRRRSADDYSMSDCQDDLSDVTMTTQTDADCDFSQ